jgi:hypothetical protein
VCANAIAVSVSHASLGEAALQMASSAIGP